MNVYTPASRARPPSVTGATERANLPGVLLQRADSDPRGVIMRKKDRGIWKEITWSDLAARARHVGLGLATIGFAPGDRAAVLAETGPDWAYADLGIIGAGGVSVGIFPTSPREQLVDVLRDSGATVLFVENEEQLDKALDVRADCPDLRRIVVFAMTGLRDLGDPMCESFQALLARGAAHEQAHPAAWQSAVDAIGGDDIAVLAYTSGATGEPKGVMLSHRTLLFQVFNGAALLEQREGDERLAVLSMCLVAERVTGLYQALYSGTITNYAEDADTALENLRELQPTIQGGVPHFWERFHSRTTIAVADATWLQRLAYRWAIGVGQRRADARLAGRGPSVFNVLAFALAYRLVLRNIRRDIGIDRLRWGFVVGAHASPELIRWYLALGVPLLDAYAVTECAGLATWTPPGAIRPNTVGKPVPYGEIALSPGGEILVRGGHVFQGYWNQPDLTGQILRDGWLHTGDSGAIEDGHLRVTGRLADIIVTAAGNTVIPSAIETALTFSPYIADAMVIGEQRHALTCLIMLDHQNVEKWAQDNAIPFTSFASLVRTDAVRGLIEATLSQANARVAPAEQIKGFVLLDRKLAPEDPELTPTMKLRRGFVQQKYAALIETLYSNS
jgi:long-chain acyl-CoA synthetase